MAIVILAATTSAANSSEFRVRGGNDKVTIVADPPLAGAEQCDLDLSTDGGTTWLRMQDGVLTATIAERKFVLADPGHYRVAKDVTASATALKLEGRCKLL
jgi:hypothetical protein